MTTITETREYVKEIANIIGDYKDFKLCYDLLPVQFINDLDNVSDKLGKIHTELGILTTSKNEELKASMDSLMKLNRTIGNVAKNRSEVMDKFKECRESITEYANIDNKVEILMLCVRTFIKIRELMDYEA